MYTAFQIYGLNYGDVDKGHRADDFTTDGGFTEYAVNNIKTLGRVPDDMSDEEATLVVTAGTSMYGQIELGGLLALDDLPTALRCARERIDDAIKVVVKAKL